MSLKEKAKKFAVNAHMGQIRKNEPDKPMIIHPISVALILEEYGYNESVVAAGYLHDVVEDTKYTIEDIKKEFGNEVADLVMSASEPDKSLSWEERKKHTIEKTKTLPLKNKLIIAADKINNLEDLIIQFQKRGKRDFSAFKRGEDKQKWYYTSVYESLIYGEDKNLPIFKRLKVALDDAFFHNKDTFLNNTIFVDNKSYYEKLKKLHAQKLELKTLNKLCKLSKPFVIEFSGTPRTGKTTTIYNLYDFFKKGDFSTTVIDEFTSTKYYKEDFKPKYKKLGSNELNIAILETVATQLESAVNSDKEIIIIDRSINDRQIWNYRRYIRNDMSEKIYLDLKNKYAKLSKDLIDFLVITYAEPLVSLKRDYNSSLALEKRNFLNIDNLTEFNNNLNALKELFKTSVDNSFLLDTTHMNMNDVSVEIASKIMSAMRKKYITNFKQNLGM